MKKSERARYLSMAVKRQCVDVNRYGFFLSTGIELVGAQEFANPDVFLRGAGCRRCTRPEARGEARGNREHRPVGVIDRDTSQVFTLSETFDQTLQVLL